MTLFPKKAKTLGIMVVRYIVGDAGFISATIAPEAFIYLEPGYIEPKVKTWHPLMVFANNYAGT